MDLTEQEKDILRQIREEEQENDDTPLTKPKKEKSLQVKPIKDDVIIPKPKRVMSEKQKEQFKITQGKRKKAIEERYLQKKIEASKLLLEHGITNKVDTDEKSITKPKKKPKIIEVEVDSDSESEPEIIYVKKPKNKKKRKQVIIEESSSEYEEDEPINKPIKSWGSSQQNKKSVVKINNNKSNVDEEIKHNYNFFCD